METLWLLTRAWNTGILLYSLAQYPEAEKWCGLAMSFIRHLGSLQESYEVQVKDKWKANEGMKLMEMVVVMEHGGAWIILLMRVKHCHHQRPFRRRFKLCCLCTHRCLISTVRSWTGWTKLGTASSQKNKTGGRSGLNIQFGGLI